MARHRSSLIITVLVAVWALACWPTVLAASAGCGKTPTLTSGTRTMTVNNKSRRWIVRLPAKYDKNHPYKLIFGLHWLNADYQGVDTGSAPYYGLKALDTNNTAIFVAPDGLNKGWGNQGGEDITFIDNIIKTIEDDLCVNEDLRFTMGFSYGGAMSYSLACSRPKVFRAVAVLSGGMLSGCNGGKDAVAYYGQHGVKDSVLNINGGHSMRDTFVKNNGCTAQTPQEPAGGSRRHIKTVYSGCSTGHPVQWTAFDGDHTALPTDSGGDGGSRSWTCGEVWNFFNQFT